MMFFSLIFASGSHLSSFKIMALAMAWPRHFGFAPKELPPLFFACLSGWMAKTDEDDEFAEPTPWPWAQEELSLGEISLNQYNHTNAS